MTLINGTSAVEPLLSFIPSIRPKTVNNSPPEAMGRRSTRNCGLAVLGTSVSAVRVGASESGGDFVGSVAAAAAFAGSGVTKNCLDDWAAALILHSTSNKHNFRERRVIRDLKPISAVNRYSNKTLTNGRVFRHLRGSISLKSQLTTNR